MVNTQISPGLGEIFYESCKTTDPGTHYTTPGCLLSDTDHRSLRRSFCEKNIPIEILSVTGEISVLTV